MLSACINRRRSPFCRPRQPASLILSLGWRPWPASRPADLLSACVFCRTWGLLPSAAPQASSCTHLCSVLTVTRKQAATTAALPRLLNVWTAQAAKFGLHFVGRVIDTSCAPRGPPHDCLQQE